MAVDRRIADRSSETLTHFTGFAPGPAPQRENRDTIWFFMRRV
jgi:hypothetical protein